VSYERFSTGSSVNVVLLSEATGFPGKGTQLGVLKKTPESSEEDTIIDAPQPVLVSEVIEVVNIASENVTMKLPVTGKHLSVNGEVNTVDPRVNCKDSTDGAIVSTK
jgi:RAB protein geranylgeranyltransferase component A